MMRLVALSTVVLFLAVSAAGQSRKKYDHFYVELNKSGKAVGVFFQAGDGVGCSELGYANGTVTSVDWDIVITRFTAKLKAGHLSFFVPDALNEIANADRGLLSDIFSKGKRVRIGWRECGSGNIPALISVKVLP